METAPASVAHAPEAVVKFVRELLEAEVRHDGEERRENARTLVSLPVNVRALDEQLQPVGEPIMLITKNLSGGGIGLLHEDPITTPYLQVTLSSRSGNAMVLVAKLQHCSLQESGLYLIGGRFVVDWKESAQR